MATVELKQYIMDHLAYLALLFGLHELLDIVIEATFFIKVLLIKEKCGFAALEIPLTVLVEDECPVLTALKQVAKQSYVSLNQEVDIFEENGLVGLACNDDGCLLLALLGGYCWRLLLYRIVILRLRKISSIRTHFHLSNYDTL